MNSSKLRGRIRAARGTSLTVSGLVTDDAVGADREDLADLAPRVRIPVAVVAVAQRVDVTFGPVAGLDVDDGTDDRDPVVRVTIGQYRNGDMWVRANVSILHPALRGVDQHVSIRGVHPCDRGVRRSIRVHRHERSVVRPREDLDVAGVELVHQSSSGCAVTATPSSNPFSTRSYWRPRAVSGFRSSLTGAVNRW